MADFDVFNGDADGLCALLQLRLAEPRDAQLVTGVKRDIQLLERVEAQRGDRITVLDVSMAKNTADLARILDAGAEVFYADHHDAGDKPESERLTALINEAPDTCTAMIINGHLRGRFAAWAVVGAFGDNLRKSALHLAQSLDLTAEQTEKLENLGIYLNYNGYGESIADLHFAPEELFRLMLPFEHPLEFIEGAGRDNFERLEQGYLADMTAAQAIEPAVCDAGTAAFIFPNAAWARRVSGVFSNDLVNRHPDRAHAVLTEKSNGNYLISVRAPLNNKTGAVDLCKQFPTGGGRAAAAGINDLPADQYDEFIARFQAFYGR